MDSGAERPGLLDGTKVLARRLMVIGENRLELLLVELQEERAKLLHGVVLALAIATFGLLAGIAFSALLVVLLWDRYPVAVLVALTVLYTGAAVVLYVRLQGFLRDWRMLSATLDQLQKDRAGLESLLE